MVSCWVQSRCTREFVYLCVLTAQDTYAPVDIFNPGISYVRFRSSCPNVHRENVTWCARLAHVNRTIETCITLDENLEPVYTSTCDAQHLRLEERMSLPSVSTINSYNRPPHLYIICHQAAIHIYCILYCRMRTVGLLLFYRMVAVLD